LCARNAAEHKKGFCGLIQKPLIILAWGNVFQDSNFNSYQSRFSTEYVFFSGIGFKKRS
jgi:hypothetical protein